MKRYQIISLLLLITSLFNAIGCSSSSSTSFATKATQLGFQPSQIQGRAFKHRVYENNHENKHLLHVYLGGDGTPWFKGRYITNDPTPLSPVMLPLMKMDNNAAIYLGRPCYHQQQMPPECEKTLWTNRRYSRSVVNSMVTALKHYMQQNNYTNVKLFGFSGGGTLAMLMAERLQTVSTVVTLAGNLDTDAWTNHHGYLPLTGSLSPAQQAPLPSRIQQFHLVGNLDKNVPPFITQPVILRQHHARYRRLANADHACCWGSVWLALLNSLKG